MTWREARDLGYSYFQGYFFCKPSMISGRDIPGCAATCLRLLEECGAPELDYKAIEKSFDCNRCGISVVGLEVPHAHMHLIPINSADDLNFGRKKLKLSPEEFKEIQEKILSQL